MMNIRTILPLVLVLGATTAFAQLPGKSDQWKLVWQDNFTSNNTLDANWDFQNSPGKSLLCSRWRENASVSNGVLVMSNKKENRGGQEFTAASLWTKKVFRYGYFECRYKYAAASGTNNSFWIMPRKDSMRFEIDINEGHYPNEIATNTHRHYPLPKYAASRSFRPGVELKPDARIDLKTPVQTDRIRLITADTRASIRELIVYSGQENVTLKATASASAALRPEFMAYHAIDGDAVSRWVSPDSTPDTLTINLAKQAMVTALQLSTGYQFGDTFRNVLYHYTIQYYTNGVWADLPVDKPKVTVDLTKEFHTYGLLWNEKELVWYFDGKEIRREANIFCHGYAPVWLSSAIANWAGPVTDSIDGTSMDVDYVRIYELKK